MPPVLEDRRLVPRAVVEDLSIAEDCVVTTEGMPVDVLMLDMNDDNNMGIAYENGVELLNL